MPLRGCLELVCVVESSDSSISYLSSAFSTALGTTATTNANLECYKFIQLCIPGDRLINPTQPHQGALGERRVTKSTLLGDGSHTRACTPQAETNTCDT